MAALVNHAAKASTFGSVSAGKGSRSMTVAGFEFFEEQLTLRRTARPSVQDNTRRLDNDTFLCDGYRLMPGFVTGGLPVSQRTTRLFLVIGLPLGPKAPKGRDRP